MSREIKFRAYYPFQNKMVTWDDLKHKLMQVLEYTSCPIMQYTGLKDKNGVEIYEGDILQIFGEGNSIGKVIFQDGSFRVVEDLKYYCHLSAYNPQVMSEVIGNIYENPELLKNHE